MQPFFQCQLLAKPAKPRNFFAIGVEALGNRPINIASGQSALRHFTFAKSGHFHREPFHRHLRLALIKRLHCPEIAEEANDEGVRWVSRTLCPLEKRIRLCCVAQIGLLQRLIGEIFCGAGKAFVIRAALQNQCFEESSGFGIISGIVAGIAFNSGLFRIKCSGLNLGKGGGIACLSYCDFNGSRSGTIHHDGFKAEL